MSSSAFVCRVIVDGSDGAGSVTAEMNFKCCAHSTHRMVSVPDGQYASEKFPNALKEHGIPISIDGLRRCNGIIFVKHLWRTEEYECIYLNVFESSHQLCEVLREYFDYSNHDRPHKALGKMILDSVYFKRRNRLTA